VSLQLCGQLSIPSLESACHPAAVVSAARIASCKRGTFPLCGTCCRNWDTTIPEAEFAFAVGSLFGFLACKDTCAGWKQGVARGAEDDTFRWIEFHTVEGPTLQTTARGGIFPEFQRLLNSY